MEKKGLTDEQWNHIAEIIQKEQEERKSEKKDLTKSVLPLLEREIRELGFNFDNTFQIKFICQKNPEITKNIIVNCYKSSIYNTEKEFLLECLYNESNTDLVPFFIEELYKNSSSLIRVPLGNCLMRTPNKIYISKYIDMMYDEGLYKEFPYIGSCLDRTANIDYKDTYLKMLQDFSSKQDVRVVFVMRTIGKLKIKEAVLPMVNMLDTSNFRDDILEALDKYKDPTLLSYFERYKNDKDTDTRNAAKKGIKTIERLLQKNKKEY